MKKPVLRILLLILVVALVLVLARWWYTQQEAKKVAAVQTSQTAAVAPPATTGSVTSALPVTTLPPDPTAPSASAGPDPLALKVPQEALEADDLFVRTLSDLITRKSLKEFFQTDAMARRVVATTDCLPRDHCSWTIWPVHRTPGRFSVVPTADGSGGTLSSGNSARYSPFLQFVEGVDTPKWITLYRQVYPLLQQAYVDLGYPNASFHDRLLQVIDHLLTAPVQARAPDLHLVEVRGPVASLQPWVRYEYTDAALESLSAGQKILVRMGAAHHQRMRIKLTSLRAALTVLPKPSPLKAP